MTFVVFKIFSKTEFEEIYSLERIWDVERHNNTFKAPTNQVHINRSGLYEIWFDSGKHIGILANILGIC